MKLGLAVFLFIMICITANSQNQKEVKSKFSQFIKEYYTLKKEINLSSANTQDFEEKSYKNFIVEFSNDNTIMTFSYDYQFEYGSIMTEVKDFYTIKNKIVLDFNTIESITLDTLKTLNQNKQFFVLNFKAKPNTSISKYSSKKDRTIPETPEKINEIIIPINTNYCNDCDYKELNNKIPDAFNELRRL